jgi:uracil permease
MASQKAMAYLPNDTATWADRPSRSSARPHHVLQRCSALFTGFHVSTVLLGSGISTIVALLLSKWRIGKFIPLYYGSSFSYLAAYLAITNAKWGIPASDDKIMAMQAGIVATGILNVIVGFLIKTVGKPAVDKVLPPVVTGSVACIIGFGLGFAALGMATGTSAGIEKGDLRFIVVSVATLMATVVFSVYLKQWGFIGMIPILLGAIFGYVISFHSGWSILRQSRNPNSSCSAVTLPDFTGPLAATAIFNIAVMALATIPNPAHLYQISLYVDRTAQEMGREKYQLDQHIGFNLILDGIGDLLHSLVGDRRTNYGENNSLMAITRNYSGPARRRRRHRDPARVRRHARGAGCLRPDGGERWTGDLSFRRDWNARHRADGGE